MQTQPRQTMNDGRSIPAVGFGTFRIGDSEVERLVGEALAAGYRSIDTAALYGNEAGVGRGIAASGLPREEIFVTTKLWNDRHHDARRACEESLAKLGLDAVDLYLIHWPAPTQNLYRQAWKELVRIRQDGLALSIGVSNFSAKQIQELIDDTGVVPAVNQIELHPYMQQKELRAFHQSKGIVTEAWSPIAKGQILSDPVLQEIGSKHEKSVVQVVLRWHLQSGVVAIPKTVHPERIRENLAIFDFELDDEDMAGIDALDRSERIGMDPATFD